MRMPLGSGEGPPERARASLLCSAVLLDANPQRYGTSVRPTRGALR